MELEPVIARRRRHAEVMSRYRAKRRDDPEYQKRVTEATRASRRRYPERQYARDVIKRALRSGRLTRPTECEHCGAGGLIEASHSDYSKPMEVEWLCPPCHGLKDHPPEAHQ